MLEGGYINTYLCNLYGLSVGSGENEHKIGEAFVVDFNWIAQVWTVRA